MIESRRNDMAEWAGGGQRRLLTVRIGLARKWVHVAHQLLGLAERNQDKAYEHLVDLECSDL